MTSLCKYTVNVGMQHSLPNKMAQWWCCAKDQPRLQKPWQFFLFFCTSVITITFWQGSLLVLREVAFKGIYVMKLYLKSTSVQFSSVKSLSHVRLYETPWIAAGQASLSITNSQSLPPCSCPSRWWCHPGISSSVIPFSSCPQSLPATEFFPVSQLFARDGQNIGVSASASILPMDIQGWFPLGLTGLIFLLSKGLSRVFSNTTVQNHQFFGTQLSL